jgi:serine/threonine protein kinase
MTLIASRSQLVGGRYRLDRRLGEGGMGVVWAATHVASGRTVALKMLKPHARARPDLQRRLLREARTAGSVKHPNVVKIHDVFDSGDDGPVIVMDLLEGETLRAKLAREERLSVDETASILLPVVSAVAAAHAEGIVHRDLKPDNIFLQSNASGAARMQVLDFGIAKLLLVTPEMADSSGLTHTGAMLGTPWYMAPEQGFGERDVDARADVWALGVILYESLSGGRPVEGDNLGQVLKRLTSQGITPLSGVAPHVPDDLAKVIDRMLAIERDERLSDLSTLQAVLERYATSHDPGSTPMPARPKARRRRAYLVASFATALAAGALWLLRPHPSNGQSAMSTIVTPSKASATAGRDGAGEHGVVASLPSATTPVDVLKVNPAVARTASTPTVAGRDERQGHRHVPLLPFAPPLTTTASATAEPVAAPVATAPSTILGGLAARPPF